MVAALTSGSPKHASVAQRCDAIGESAVAISNALLGLVDEDASAFDRVSSAYKMAKHSEAEKRTRSAAIQQALESAIQAPSRVIAHAREICDLAAELIDIGNPSALSDIGCAALCAQTAAHGAALNVEINARSLKDRTAAEQHVEQAFKQIGQVNLLCEVILGKLRAKTER